MLKHIGRHGDRKVAIVFRQIPGEDHMCLVVYPDVLPTHIHNSVMATLESAPGQAASNLADVFHRNLLPDGRAILEALHREGMLKKVATAQVIVTPTATSSVKLDEINRLVKEMESGADALKRMQQLDASAGIVDPSVKRAAEEAFKSGQQNKQAPVTPLVADSSHALDDKTLAGNMLQQAKRMEIEAKGMISEAAKMKKDAERMFPGVSRNDGSLDSAPASTVEPKAKARTRKKTVAADAVQ
jgi:hypothetical protein